MDVNFDLWYRRYRDSGYGQLGTFAKDEMLSQLVHCNPQFHHPSCMSHPLQQSPDQNYNSVHHYRPLSVNLGLLTHWAASGPSEDCLWNYFHSSFPPSDCQVYLDWLRFCVPYSQ